MQKLLLFSKLLMLSFALLAASHAQTPRDIAAMAFKSVVLLSMNDKNSQPLCIGSGFFVSENVIATNAHVIEGTWSGSAKIVGQDRTFQILGTLAVDEHADLALLSVAAKVPSLKLSASPLPAVGDHVYVVGNPLGLEGTFSEGNVSGIRKTGNDSIIQMTAPISPGSSGGPVLDSTGEVVGVSVATFNAGQNLNLAVPVSFLIRLLNTKSASALPLGSEQRNAIAKASIIDGFGTKTEEGVTATDFQLSDFRQYKIRLTNRLPVAVSDISVLVIFYDRTGKMLDFDRLEYTEAIPAGLTKEVMQNTFNTDSIIAETWYHGRASFKTDTRVVGFKTGTAH